MNWKELRHVLLLTILCIPPVTVVFVGLVMIFLVIVILKDALFDSIRG